MMDCHKDWVRLPLEHAYNVRELGGYPVQGGGQTAYHRFLRADNISKLSDHDVEFLLGYGVHTVIDLRSEEEAEAAPDRLAGMDGVWYIRIPLLDKDATDISSVTQPEIEMGLSILYAGMLRRKETVKRLFTAVAEAPEGCVLFHCTAGKDRTGVMAMLLMSLAGVQKNDCVTNYAQSYINLAESPEMIVLSKRKDFAKYAEMFFSCPETIGGCYDKLMEEYGSTENYLRECGLSDEVIEAVKRRVLSD